MTDPEGPRWDRPGPLTIFDADVAPTLAGLPHDPIELCRAAQGLVMLPQVEHGRDAAVGRVVTNAGLLRRHE
jgi:hypothetical protein